MDKKKIALQNQFWKIKKIEYVTEPQQKEVKTELKTQNDG